jgi:antagonist of KipI
MEGADAVADMAEKEVLKYGKVRVVRGDFDGQVAGGRLQVAEEMISTAVSMGTVQVIPDGSPLILMADAQTTGGYPRIAQVIDADLPILAQKRPGDKIRFREVSIPVAEELYINRQEELIRLKRNIRTKFSI